MTEKSYFWDGLAIGDAKESPFSSQELASFIRLIGTQEGVIPYFLDELQVTYAANAVTVGAGGAVVNGHIYINTQPIVFNLTDAPNPRYDKLFLRADTASNTVRLVLSLGSNDYLAVPEAPYPLQTATQYDLEIARIYVTGSPAVGTVYDRRSFIYTTLSANFDHVQNILPNSEFISYSAAHLKAITGNLYAPDGWDIPAGASPSSLSVDDKFDTMFRGHTITLSLTSNGQRMGTYVRLPGYEDEIVDTSGDRMITIRGLIHVQQGSVDIHVHYDGGTETVRYYATDNPQEFIFHPYVTNNIIGLEFEGVASTISDVRIGQIQISPGHHTPGYYPIHEIVWSDHILEDPDYAGASGSTLIDLNEDFYGLLGGQSLTAFYIRARVRDSQSTTGAAGTFLIRNGSAGINAIVVEVRNVADDGTRSGAGWVINQNDELTFTVVKSAAGSFIENTEITGIHT